MILHLPCITLLLLLSSISSHKDSVVALQPSTVADSNDLNLDLHRSLRFDPPQIDFGTMAVGTASSHVVTLVNANRERSVFLTSVSGRTPQFYSSFFETKVIPPRSNTTFNVVFLPREHGAVVSDLMVHTSFGEARLMVKGVGRECPYRLKPIVGIKAPLNATLTPEIYMYNPHEAPLQILEVYSSGGQFQLELPSGSQEGPQALWEIPAFTSKPVIRIRFHGQTAGNYTAYIRIKISELPNNALTPKENVLVIPVEFEILSQYGLYAENPLIDFGRQTTYSDGPPIQIKLELRNSNERRPHEVFKVDLERFGDGLVFNPQNSSLMLNARAFSESTRLRELVTVHSAVRRGSSKAHSFSLLVSADIYKGSLWYDRNVTTFMPGPEKYVQVEWRQFVVRNDFRFPIALLNVSADHCNVSQVVVQLNGITYGSKTLLSPGRSLELLRLKATGDLKNSQSKLIIYTNVSNFEVPIGESPGKLHVSTHTTGRLTAYSPYSLELDLGGIPLAEMSHTGYIALHNPNPFAIKVNWDFQSPHGVYFQINLLGCMREEALESLLNYKPEHIASSKFRFCSQMNYRDVAVFQVAIQSYSTEHFGGKLKIWTAYERFAVAVKFKTWLGKLEVDQKQISFKNCFPGKICSSDLSVHSTFQHPIHITDLNFTDDGLRFEEFNSKAAIIAPDATKKLGRIFFDPAKLCRSRCYVSSHGRANAMAFPLPQDTKGGLNNNFHFDEQELRRRAETFRHLKWYLQSLSFGISSREVPQFTLTVAVDIEWPKLVDGVQTFPQVEVGKTQQLAMTIRNPSDAPLLVDYYLADPQYAKETKLSLPQEIVNALPSCYLTDKPVFSLTDEPPEKPLLLPPRGTHKVLLNFDAHQADTHCTLLHLRNNLTLYEAVWLSAKAVRSQFSFGNRKPGSTTALMFNIDEKQLAGGCNHGSLPRVFQKRVFTARNTGEVPVWVDGFLIENRPCSGFGFRIKDCDSFLLTANASRKIEITFTPDFTATRIAKTLTIKTNMSYPVTYSLLAQLPSQGLDSCLALVPRPYWEFIMRNSLIMLLTITFVFVVIAVYIDFSDIFLSQSEVFMARDKGPVYPTFNLRNIAMRSLNTMDLNNATAASAADVGRPNSNNGRSNGNNHQKANQSGGNNNYNSGSNVRRRPGKKGGGNSQADILRKNEKSAPPPVPPSVAEAVPISPMPDMSWAYNLTPPASPVRVADIPPAVMVTPIPTFSERNFKLKMEANRMAAMVTCCSCPCPMACDGVVEFPPPPIVTAEVNVQSASANGSGSSIGNGIGSGSGSGTKKSQQRGGKKIKGNFSPMAMAAPAPSPVETPAPANTVPVRAPSPPVVVAPIPTPSPSPIRNPAPLPSPFLATAPTPTREHEIAPEPKPKSSPPAPPPSKPLAVAADVAPAAKEEEIVVKKPKKESKICQAVETKCVEVQVQLDDEAKPPKSEVIPEPPPSKRSPSPTPEIEPSSTPAEVTVPVAIPSKAIVTTSEIPVSSAGGIDANRSVSNAPIRKHGKTPGRERKKATAIITQQPPVETSTPNNGSSVSSSSASSISSSTSTSSSLPIKAKRKSKVHIGFTFPPEPLVEIAPANPSPINWDAGSQVSFSEVLQSPSPINLPEEKPLELMEKRSESVHSLLDKPETVVAVDPIPSDQVHSLLDKVEEKAKEKDKKKKKKTSIESYQVPVDAPIISEQESAIIKAAELGPIGSRKSPSSTPTTWEAVGSSSSAVKKAVDIAKPITITNNSSFFSNPLPNYSFKPPEPTEPPAFGLGVPTPEDYTTQWFELKKAQEEIQRAMILLSQQKLEAELKKSMEAVAATASLAANNWSPIPDDTPAWSPMNYGQNVADSLPQIQTSLGGNISPLTSGWQATSAAISRPPPGLETVSGLQQLVQNEQHGNNLLSNVPGASDAPAFDPFNSLRSIWPDNWNGGVGPGDGNNDNLNNNNNGNRRN